MLLNTSACPISTASNAIVSIRTHEEDVQWLRAEGEETTGESLSDNKVRRISECRTFFPKAA